MDPGAQVGGGREECTACRGTGEAISNLGGTPSLVTCPWCEGTGRFIVGHDAQAARRAAGGEDGQALPAPAPDASID